jgi:hypothetical protein
MIDFIHVANGICPAGQHRVTRLLPGPRGADASDWIAGGFGGVGSPRRSGPPEGTVGELVDRPFRVLFEAVVVAAFGPGVAAAGPAACLVGGVVLHVALDGGPPADRAGAGGVPYLDQVLERDPGVVAAGLVPVVAGVGGQRFQGDDQVRPGSGVRSRQVPWPPGGPSRLAGVNVNPVSRGGPGPARCLRLLGSGRAQP